MNELDRSLEWRLKMRIEADGPLTIGQYMTDVLFDPLAGYYTTAHPFGREGDFITAPEVSQMFGELIGGWLVQTWENLGSPNPFILVELGPGRGVLMADILRTAALEPRFMSALKLVLVEKSLQLQREQSEALAGFPVAIEWAETIDELPQGPILLVANEFFDALPIRQFQFTENGWHERVIGLSDAGQLAFGLTKALPEPHWLGGLPKPAMGDLVEVSPVSVKHMSAIAKRLATSGGAALIVDYGHAERGYGSTLQAMRRHSYVDPLETPGRADVTAHVDFALLGSVAHAQGTQVSGPVTQGDFLISLGLLERAGHLGSGESEETQNGQQAHV